jgi:PIN domain
VLGSMPLIVCIDTNVFVRQAHLLRKNAGPSLIHLLRAAGGRLFVPEILKREYEEQTVAAVNEAGEKITAQFERIQTLVGARDDFVLPTDDQVRTSVRGRLAELEAITLSQPLTDELRIAAGNRVLEKRAPTTKTDHGYKDCLIWEGILRLEHGADIRLITLDGTGFLASERLLPALQEEAARNGVNITAHRELEAVLSELQAAGTPPIPQQIAQDTLHRVLQDEFAKVIQQWQLSSLGPMEAPRFTPFVTEDLRRLWVKFEVRLPAGTAVNGEKLYEGNNQVELEGSFNWHPDVVGAGALTDLLVERETLLGTDGAVIGQNITMFLEGHAFGGRALVHHRDRRPLAVHHR